jgi:DNA (cytosine-5)-methyltransferase 1
VFSGAGGLAEGFRQTGFAIVSGVDMDPVAGATFRSNFPEASFFECAIGDLDAKHLLADSGLQRGELDCLIGGPPCQSFSYNNHQRSASGVRSRLFREYLRLVEALNPRHIVMENVPGILTIGNGKVVAQITESLAELGYRCEARILYAEDYGVPQERRRVFFVGSRMKRHRIVFPTGTHGPAEKPQNHAASKVHHWKPGRAKAKPLVTVWDAISDLAALGNGKGTALRNHSRRPRTEFQVRMRKGAKGILRDHVCRTLTPAVLKRIATVPTGGNWRDIPRRRLPAGMKRAHKSDHTKRYGRPAKSDLACTILTKCDPHWGAYIHPTDDRVMSVREIARLQSFPDRFQFSGGIGQQYLQIGNAVPPLLARAIGKEIRRTSRAARKPISAKRRKEAGLSLVPLYGRQQSVTRQHVSVSRAPNTKPSRAAA